MGSDSHGAWGQGPALYLGSPQPRMKAGLQGGQHCGHDPVGPRTQASGTGRVSQALVPTEPPPHLTPHSVRLEELGAGPGLAVKLLERVPGAGDTPPASRHNWEFSEHWIRQVK